mgnify:CR=1 FL=1
MYINKTANVLCHFVVTVTLTFAFAFLLGTATGIIQW